MVDAPLADDRELNLWRAELVRALGGEPDDVQAVLIEGIVQRRALLLSLGALESELPGVDIRPMATHAVLGVVWGLKTLGFTRQKARQLDLKRTRRVVH